MNSIELDAWSTRVLAELHQIAAPSPPLIGSWSPHELTREGTAHFVRVSVGGTELVRARWGRSSQSDRRYLDRNSPPSINRGLIFATGFTESVAGNERHERFFQWWRVTPAARPWIAIGCSWEENQVSGEIEFSVLTNPAGPDLRACLEREPLVIPPVRWREWLNNKSVGDFAYVTPPGTLLAARM
jgi:putative SOS response-associated peptidase YedK